MLQIGSVIIPYGIFRFCRRNRITKRNLLRIPQQILAVVGKGEMTGNNTALSVVSCHLLVGRGGPDNGRIGRFKGDDTLTVRHRNTGGGAIVVLQRLPSGNNQIVDTILKHGSLVPGETDGCDFFAGRGRKVKVHALEGLFGEGEFLPALDGFRVTVLVRHHLDAGERR